MQKGFATLEIIFLVIIIGILMSVAVPQAVTLVERVTLDYEHKRLYSELKYLQTLDRTSDVSDWGMGDVFVVQSKADMHFINGNRYEIQRNSKTIREPHYLSNGVTFSLDTVKTFRLDFDDEGKSKFYGAVDDTDKKTIRLSPRSRSIKSLPTIVFDSVGRIRGGREER